MLARVDGETGLEGELAGARGEAPGGALAKDLGAVVRELEQGGRWARAKFGGEVA